MALDLSLNYNDPKVRAAALLADQQARKGKKYTSPPTIPEITKAYQQDPKTRLAVTALATGSSTDPVAQGKYAYADGIARALTGVAGGYIDKKQQQKYGPMQDDTLLNTAMQEAAKAQRGDTVLAPGTPPPDPPPPPEALQQQPAPPPQAPQMPAATPQQMAVANTLTGGLPPAGGLSGGPGAAPTDQLALSGGRPMGQSPFPAGKAAGGGGFSLASGRDALKALGATVTSGYRTKAQQEALIKKWEAGGGKGVRPADNSFHTRGTEDNPGAYDFTPKAGQSMAQLEAQARKAFPGYDVINEGNHVHVEPSPAMAAAGNSGGAAGGGSVPLAGGGVAADGLPALPEAVKEPDRPQAVGPTRSLLMQAAYDIALDRDPFQYTRGRELSDAGMTEQAKFNEAASLREQGIRDEEYKNRYGLYSDDAKDRRGFAYDVRKEAYDDARDPLTNRLDRAQRAEEARLNRAADLEQTRIAAAAKEAAKKPLKAPAKIAAGYANNNAAIASIDKAIAAIKANPGHLGLKNYLGDDASQRLDPAGVAVRAAVSDIGSKKRHDRTGATMSNKEAPLLKPFVPQVTDKDQVAIDKLLGLREKYMDEQTAMEINYGEDKGYDPLDGSGGGAKPMTDAERLAKYGIQ